MNVSIHTHDFNHNTIEVVGKGRGGPWFSLKHTARPKVVDKYTYVMPDEVTFHLGDMTIEEMDAFLDEADVAIAELQEWQRHRKVDANLELDT